ncbi:MAG: hypothetical protein JWP51_4954 [Bradyrhizobium sp.]|jgi:hypothetical protein|nr:hypothetical protein [Bradyrhizobium sp.]
MTSLGGRSPVSRAGRSTSSSYCPRIRASFCSSSSGWTFVRCTAMTSGERLSAKASALSVRRFQSSVVTNTTGGGSPSTESQPSSRSRASSLEFREDLVSLVRRRKPRRPHDRPPWTDRSRQLAKEPKKRRSRSCNSITPILRSGLRMRPVQERRSSIIEKLLIINATISIQGHFNKCAEVAVLQTTLA